MAADVYDTAMLSDARTKRMLGNSGSFMLILCEPPIVLHGPG